jgi:hypothetical protein
MKVLRANVICCLFAAVVLLSSCHKEDRLVQNLEGRWRWTGIEDAPAMHISVNDSTQHFFHFLPCRKAYTASCRCVYTIEKNWLVPAAPSDTFIYDIKDHEMAITQFLTTNTAPNSNTNGILKDRRFTIILKNNTLELRNVQKNSFKIICEKIP